MFDKILIANRGEIACRVAATARRMGIGTVAVYSEADRTARHVRMADESIYIGAAPAAESYLSIERIVRACRASGAAAVHPGYGFLSENAAFAREVEAAGLTFIGPPSSAIAALGDKVSARELARQTGLEIVPGSDLAVDSAEEALAAASAIGFPVMIKARAGGGGRGLRIVRSESEVAEAYGACRREAGGAFGDDRVYLEKHVDPARHIEIQVLADAHGNVVHLGERDCSMQRRHQKVLEEAPSPFLDVESRAAVAAQAVALASAAGYRSAGTVEFIVDAQRKAYFLEVNTRLQVEHCVTEMLTGIDIVEWMIRIAAGEALPWAQQEIVSKGHAIECRINAESPERRFLPALGRLTRYSPPAEVAGSLRVESGLDEGDTIGPHYDSLMGKVIAAAPTRAEAIEKMAQALDGFAIRGVSSNAGFQSALIRHPAFVAGDYTTGFVDAEYGDGFRGRDIEPDMTEDFVVVAAVAYRRAQECATRVVGAPPPPSYRYEDELIVRLNEAEHVVRVREMRGTHRVTLGGSTFDVSADWRFYQPVVRGTIHDRPFVMQLERHGNGWRLARGGIEVDVQVLPRRASELMKYAPKPAAELSSKEVRAPMAGVIVGVAVSVGQAVRVGDPIATIESMKMENVVQAEVDGAVAQVLVRQGDMLSADQVIVTLD